MKWKRPAVLIRYIVYGILLLDESEFVGEFYMSYNGILILSITWLLLSLVWFFAIENTAVGIIWLCAGIVELIIALIKRNKEKKSK